MYIYIKKKKKEKKEEKTHMYICSRYICVFIYTKRQTHKSPHKSNDYKFLVLFI